MGPPIKPIEDKSSRGVNFSNRQTGLVKKPRVFGDGNVALVLFLGGRVHDFSPDNSLVRIIQQYKNQSEAEGSSSTTGCDTERGLASSHETCPEPLQIVERKMEESELEELSFSDLLQVEEQLKTALRHLKSLKVKMLQEEIRALKEKLAASRADGNEGRHSTPEE